MTVSNKARELTPQELRWRCELKSIPYETSQAVEPDDVIIGQERAVEAIKLGLEVGRQGYNIFISGMAGTGRTTTVKHLLETMVQDKGLPPDIVYLHNFKDPEEPKAVILPAGDGCRFKTAMERLVNDLVRDVTSLFESDKYQEHRKSIVRNFQAKQKEILQAFEKEIAAENFALVQVQVGPFVKPDLHPVIDGRPISFDELEVLVREGKIPEDDLHKFEEKYQELEARLHEVFKATREVVLRLEETLHQLERKRTEPVVKNLIGVVRADFTSPGLQKHLDEVADDVVKNLPLFTREKGSNNRSEDQQGKREPDAYLAYRVNVIVDNCTTKKRPIVIETNPTFRNLFGMIERESDGSRSFRTDFTKIKAGSLLKASGGFLVINALDALIEPGVWPALKRTLRNNKVEILSYDPFHMLSATALKPQAVEISVKVIMIGDHYLYDLLYFADEDFKKTFKVLAQFDTSMKLEGAATVEYAKFISKICARDKLRPFDRTGMAGVIEYGVRLAGRRNKVTTRFNLISDLLREADFWAAREKAEAVTYEHVNKAIENWKKRMNLPEEKINEAIEEGTIMIDTTGSVVGQINGLSVYDLGQYQFGKPTRITATVSVGRSGVINIEREAELSGPTHNKGVLILGGLLRSRYAKDKPLAVSASICFEQSYGGVDGDSASSTEVYALLSALSGKPIRQDLAVTGSVNQKGEIQPIGGVNHKIEGFFDVCIARGLTGTQGVLIPKQNTDDLMLKTEVVEAVKSGRFHIYEIESIDQGVELLTGVPAGDRQPDGSYPNGTINRLVDDRVSSFARIMKDYPGGV